MGCGASSRPGRADGQLEGTSQRAEADLPQMCLKEPQKVQTPQTNNDTRTVPEPDEGTEKVDAANSDCCGTESRRSRNVPIVSNTVFERALLFASRIPLFQKIPQADLPLIVKAMLTSSYRSGEVVIQQGEMTDSLFLILSGDVQVVRCTGEGDSSKEEVHVTLHSGDYFGEREVVLAEAARATIRAAGEQDLMLYSITHNAFRDLRLHERLCLPKRNAILGLRRACTGYVCSPRTIVEKTESELTFLIGVLQTNQYLPTLYDITDDLVTQLATAAVKRTACTGEVIFTQGKASVGRLCIVESGAFVLHAEAQQDEAFVELAGSWGAAFGVQRGAKAGSWDNRMVPGNMFGELEMLYSLPSAATVSAAEHTVYWAIERDDFMAIFGSQVEHRVGRIAKALRSVRVFAKLYQEEVEALARALLEVPYAVGEDVATQGEASDTCYILTEGEIQVLQDGEEIRRCTCTAEQPYVNLGEAELLEPGQLPATLRVASETAKVVEIDRKAFELVLQLPFEDMMQVASRTPMSTSARKNLFWRSVPRKNTGVTSEHGITRESLELVGRIGAGHFGTVDLAVEGRTGRRFALKRVMKDSVSDSWHQRQIRMEKGILSMTSSPFLVQLYAAYKDPKSWVFLLELVTGGDLRSALFRDDIRGNESCARFYGAGIILAIEHMHERRIVHRDLKPDNILLDEFGWPKVTDFGLAKFCVGKTFTACGTPVYMAPEAFQAAGHGLAFDWWSLGVLIYELMAGHVPFESATGNFQEVLQKITRGIPRREKWPWPQNFDVVLIKFLMNFLQTEEARRLPMRHNGMKAVKRNSWLQEIKWEAYEARTLQPPVTPPQMGSLRPCSQQPADGSIADWVDWEDEDDNLDDNDDE